MPLIQISDSYNLIHKWFDYLKTKGHKIIGYVIMPNHLHAVINFTDTGQSINTIIGNDKQFIAYNVIKRLQEKNEVDLLKTLSKNVEAKRKANRKYMKCGSYFLIGNFVTVLLLHNKNLIIYIVIHAQENGICALSPIDYKHSSAKHYLEGVTGNYAIDEIEE